MKLSFSDWINLLHVSFSLPASEATPQNGAGPPEVVVDSQELMDTIPGSPDCLSSKDGDKATITTPRKNTSDKSVDGSSTLSSPVSTTTHAAWCNSVC